MMGFWCILVGLWWFGLFVSGFCLFYEVRGGSNFVCRMINDKREEYYVLIKFWNDDFGDKILIYWCFLIINELVDLRGLVVVVFVLIFYFLKNL